MEPLNLLFKTAFNTMQNAYAPYSNFKVGAALIAEDGRIYSGCNVENVSFPCGTCAEAGAIAAMVAGGSKLIKEILVISGGTSLISPCGACLQRILEFSDSHTLVHLANLNGVQKTCRISDFLPIAFHEESLKND